MSTIEFQTTPLKECPVTISITIPTQSACPIDIVISSQDKPEFSIGLKNKTTIKDALAHVEFLALNKHETGEAFLALVHMLQRLILDCDEDITHLSTTFFLEQKYSLRRRTWWLSTGSEKYYVTTRRV